MGTHNAFWVYHVVMNIIITYARKKNNHPFILTGKFICLHSISATNTDNYTVVNGQCGWIYVLITSRKFCYDAISTVAVEWLTYGITGQGLPGVMDSWCPSIALNCENGTLGSATTESHQKVLILQRNYSISTTSRHGSHHIFTREIARWQRRQPWPKHAKCKVELRSRRQNVNKDRIHVSHHRNLKNTCELSTTNPYERNSHVR